MRKNISYILILVSAISLILWVLLGHVLYKDIKNDYAIKSRDGYFTAYINHIKPFNPIGVYCQITSDTPAFISLYDKEGRYLGQSSPFTCISAYEIANVLFPRDGKLPHEAPSPEDSLFGAAMGEHEKDMEIDINNKRWWSIILTPFS
ncbi:DUF6201 family protein [Aeromonas cavernicola]|uniref:Uncharacterized protein n=1 Tax=Aeromonas cavernicola TaxID=1006623 RepID=A0A2H9U789_9GAMM|nr:DUF6201 family protein [Aeromonas cavernicola]PJG59917.1 hypothetical protein CUC53_04635 [Aeromonas cavernicola]